MVVFGTGRAFLSSIIISILINFIMRANINETTIKVTMKESDFSK